MIINSNVHIVTWSLKPVKDSLTSSECPTCNHPVAHVLKAVQYVHLQSWKLIFHSPLHTKFSISLNFANEIWIVDRKYIFIFLLKRLKKQFCSIITLLVENFVLLIFQSSEKAQKKQHITFSIITLLVENSILLFLSSRTSRLCQEENLWEFFWAQLPLNLCYQGRKSLRSSPGAAFFTQDPKFGGRQPVHLFDRFISFFVDFRFKALIVN